MELDELAVTGRELPAPPAGADAAAETEEPVSHAHHRSRLRRTAVVQPETLNDRKLLELLLFEVMPRCDTSDAAKEILEACGGVAGILDAASAALPADVSAGASTAQYLQTVAALCRRYLRGRDPGCSVFWSLREARAWFLDRQLCRCQAEVVVFTLSEALQRQRYVRRPREQMDLTEFARQTVRDALSDGARYIFLAFTHPGGFLAPDMEERDMIKRMSDMCMVNGLWLADGLILNSDGAWWLSASSVFIPYTFLPFETPGAQFMPC